MWGGQSPLNLKCSTYTGLKSLGDLENFGDSNKGWVFPFGLDLLKVKMTGETPEVRSDKRR